MNTAIESQDGTIYVIFLKVYEVTKMEWWLQNLDCLEYMLRQAL